MENILALIKSQIGDQGVDALSKQLGEEPSKVNQAIEGMVPTMLGAMANNTQSKDGAQGLLAALDRDHDGSILDDVAGFFQQGDNKQGAGILKHVLGDKRSAIENGISQKSGLSGQSASKLMEMLAPVVMGFLGKQKKETSSGFDLDNIGGLLQSLAGDADKGTGLDLGDLLNMVGGLGGKSNQGGLGGMAGGLLKGLFGK